MGVRQLQRVRRHHRSDGLVLFQSNHCHALTVAGGLGRDLRRANQQHPAGAGADGKLGLLRQEEELCQRFLVAVGLQQLAAVLLGGVGAERNFRALAAGKEEQHIAAVVAGDHHGEHVLALVHAQTARDENAHLGHLAVLQLSQTHLVHLLLVGKEQRFYVVAGLDLLHDLVAFFQLVGTGGAQTLRRDLFEVALAGKEHRHGVIRRFFLLGAVLILRQIVQDLAAAGLAVLLGNIVQLIDDDAAEAGGLCKDIVQVGNVLLQLFDLAGALEDIFPVQMTQLDLGHIVGLYFIDAKTDHQVGHHFGLFLGGADNFDCLVNVQQDSSKTLEQVQALFLAVQVVVGAAAHALHAEGRPLLENFAHAHHAGLAGHQNIEVSAEAVFQRGSLKQLCHQLVGIHAALEVQCQLQAVQVGLVTHVADLLDLAGLDQLCDLVHDGLHRGGWRDLGDLDHVFAQHHIVAGAYLHAAAAVLVNFTHLRFIVQNLTAAHEVRGRHGGGDVVVLVLHQGHGGGAQLCQIERADVAGHAHSDAQRVVGQNGGEGDRQQGRLGGGAVVVGHKVHGLLVDIPEQLLTHTLQLCLGVTGSSAGHIAAVGLAKVALAVHKGHQQALVTAAHAHHGVVDGGIAVGVQVHGAAHDVGRLGACALEQAHLVHGVQQLAVCRFEAVDLWQRAADDDAHGVGHIVGFQRAGDGVLQHTAGI